MGSRQAATMMKKEEFLREEKFHVWMATTPEEQLMGFCGVKATSFLSGPHHSLEKGMMEKEQGELTVTKWL